MTCNVFGGTLDLALSIYLMTVWCTCFCAGRAATSWVTGWTGTSTATTAALYVNSANRYWYVTYVHLITVFSWLQPCLLLLLLPVCHSGKARVIFSSVCLSVAKIDRKLTNLQGFQASWKALDFKFPGPGKSLKMSLSWKFLEFTYGSF